MDVHEARDSWLIGHRPILRLALGLLAVAAACGGGAPSSAPSEAPSVPPSEAPTATPTEAASGSAPIVVAQIEREPALPVVWQSDKPQTTRRWVWEPAIDSTGRIWVASSFDSVFWIFDADGKYIESFGGKGREDGQFILHDADAGHGSIAFRSDGGFYVADWGNYRIQQFEADGTFVKAWGGFGTDDGEFTEMVDIAADAANNVYLLTDRLEVFDGDGKFIRNVTAGTGPYIDVTADGTVYAVDNRSGAALKVFEPGGKLRATYDLSDVLDFVTDVDVTPDGRIFLNSASSGSSLFEYEDLVELDAAGTILHRWPNGGEGAVIDAETLIMYVTFSDKSPGVQALQLPAK